MYAQVGKETNNMVYKELHFTEYVYKGKKFQWATLTIGKVNPLVVQISYDQRTCTTEHVSLLLEGKYVLAVQNFSDFDIVCAHRHDESVIFYTKEAGFNIHVLYNYGKAMTWGYCSETD